MIMKKNIIDISSTKSTLRAIRREKLKCIILLSFAKIRFKYYEFRLYVSKKRYERFNKKYKKRFGEQSEDSSYD